MLFFLKKHQDAAEKFPVSGFDQFFDVIRKKVFLIELNNCLNIVIKGLFVRNLIIQEGREEFLKFSVNISDRKDINFSVSLF